MKAQKLLFAAAAVLTFTACSKKPKEQKAQVSYSIGASFGKSLKAQNLDLDIKQLGNGVMDGFNGKELQLTDVEMQAALAQLAQNRQAEQVVTAEKNKVKADEFIAKNREEEGVQVTKSGLQYKILTEGSGGSPKIDDSVIVHYKGTLIDGTEFDSSFKRNQPAEFPIKGVIPGWTEGLQMMKKGSKMMFYIPPELGYGAQSRQQIPPNAVLIFEVELLDFHPAPPGRASQAGTLVKPTGKAGKPVVPPPAKTK